MFGRRKMSLVSHFPYDPAKHEPVIRSSICTGEKVFGFRDKVTKDFHEVSLIRDHSELKQYLDFFKISEDDVKTIY
jgi:hypothetical protein